MKNEKNELGMGPGLALLAVGVFFVVYGLAYMEPEMREIACGTGLGVTALVMLSIFAGLGSSRRY